MTQFDTVSRSLIGEDALAVIREFAASDAAPDSPLKGIAMDYLANGAGFGPLENRLALAMLADTIGALDARLKRLERRED